MKWIFGCAGVIVIIIFILCICLALITVPDVSDQGSINMTSPTNPNPLTPPPSGPTITPGGPTLTPIPTVTPGGPTVTPQATCPNAGVSYADNPFSGWPQSRSWGDVNYFYCDPAYEPIFGTTHWGIDIQAYHGEPVFATADAYVVRVSNDDTWGMGKNIKICTSSGWCAIYMHLTDWAVSANDSVVRGQVLGYANSTGNSTGDHLHYQIESPAGYTVDPAPTFN